MLKNQIFTSSDVDSRFVHKINYRELLASVANVLLQRKLAYAFAVILIVFIGSFGLMEYYKLNDQVAIEEKSPAAFMVIKNSVEDFKVKSQNLAQIAKFNPKDIPLAVKEVKDSAKEIADAIKKDPQLAKEVALDINNNKTYLDIQGGESDLQGTLDVLYKTTVEQLIKDFDSVTLTESQQKSLDRIKDLLNQTSNSKEQNNYDFADGLEDILLLNAAIEEK